MPEQLLLPNSKLKIVRHTYSESIEIIMLLMIKIFILKKKKKILNGFTGSCHKRVVTTNWSKWHFHFSVMSLSRALTLRFISRLKIKLVCAFVTFIIKELMYYIAVFITISKGVGEFIKINLNPHECCQEFRQGPRSKSIIAHIRNNANLVTHLNVTCKGQHINIFSFKFAW